MKIPRLLGPGPYTARPAIDGDQNCAHWYVTNDGRRNVLSFEGGAVFTSRERAEAIASGREKVAWQSG